MPKKMEDHSLRRLEKRLRGWLKEDGLEVTGLKIDGAIWAFRFKRGFFECTVGLPLESAHRIEVTVHVKAPEEQAKSFRGAEDSTKYAFAHSLRADLIRLEVNVKSGDGFPEQVSLARSLYTEDLTRTSFMEAVQSLNRAVMMIAITFSAHFGGGWHEADPATN